MDGLDRRACPKRLPTALTRGAATFRSVSLLRVLAPRGGRAAASSEVELHSQLDHAIGRQSEVGRRRSRVAHLPLAYQFAGTDSVRTRGAASTERRRAPLDVPRTVFEHAFETGRAVHQKRCPALAFESAVGSAGNFAAAGPDAEHAAVVDGADGASGGVPARDRALAIAHLLAGPRDQAIARVGR